MMKTTANIALSIYNKLITLNLNFRKSKNHIRVGIRPDELHILRIDDKLVFIRGLKNGRLRLAILNDNNLLVHEI